VRLKFDKDINNNVIIPNQRTISYYKMHAISPRTKEILEALIKSISKYKNNFGIYFDDQIVKIPKPTSIPIDKDKKQYRMEAVRKKVAELAKKIILPNFKFPKTGKNMVYGAKDLFGIMMQMSLESKFANGGAEDFKKELVKYRIQRKSPQGQTFLNRIKKYDGEIELLQKNYEKDLDEILKLARKKNLLNSRKGLTIAIDQTTIPYRGKDNNVWITYYKKGTKNLFVALKSW